MGLQTLFLLLLAIVPPLLLIYLIYKLDKYEKEPFKVCFIVFILGCATCFPIVIVEFIAMVLIELRIPEGSFFSYTLFAGTTNIKILVTMIFGVALIEEYFKYLVLTKYAYKQDSFNEPMDGIVYGVIASLGFALVENIVYVFLYADPGQEMSVGILRMFTAIPAHALMGVIMGYYVGKAKFDNVNSKKLMSKGLLGAIILHSSISFRVSRIQSVKREIGTQTSVAITFAPGRRDRAEKYTSCRACQSLFRSSVFVVH